MNGYLLLLAHEKSNAIRGKNPNIANTARRPTSRSGLPNLEPQAPKGQARRQAVATNAIGANQKIGLSASRRNYNLF